MIPPKSEENPLQMEQYLSKMRLFFRQGESQKLSYRIAALTRLRHAIVAHEDALLAALHSDLHKSSFEGYSTEISLVLQEIDYQTRCLKRWAKARAKAMPFIFFPSRSKILMEPYGVVLIMAPWNYPFQLLFSPLVAALAAGNAVVLKDSPDAPATSAVMDEIVTSCFPKEYVSIFHGHRAVNTVLLANRFDYIFYTGSPLMGKVVMAAAAKYLTPLTLELGGKSPCIIDSDADLKVAAQRVVWGKTINAGQTCIAPDYLLVHKNVRSAFLIQLKRAFVEMFGEKPENSPDYPRIVSDKAMQRLCSYIEASKASNNGCLTMGGKYDLDSRFIDFCVLENIPDDAAIWQEEIFGPIFPLKEFDHIDQVIQFVQEREKPLALYYFGRNRKNIRRMMQETSSGGACINDVLLHVANHSLPFGGVGNSGMGSYHGRYGFETFSHKKAVVYSHPVIDFAFKYPPYGNKFKWLKPFI